MLGGLALLLAALHQRVGGVQGCHGGARPGEAGGGEKIKGRVGAYPQQRHVHYTQSCMLRHLH